MHETEKQNNDAPESSAEERIAKLTEQLAERDRALEAATERLQELERQHEKDQKLIVELEKEATFDLLTGVRNRRGTALEIGRILDESKAIRENKVNRKENPNITVLLLDIDRFKNVNDLYGHAAGDAVLKALAERLPQIFKRKGDIVSRDGGEEFVCILPGVDARTAYNVLLQRLGNQGGDHLQIVFPIDVEDNKGNTVTLPITFSGGIVDIKEGGSYEDAKKAADALLYEAKTSGRNRILIPEFSR